MKSASLNQIWAILPFISACSTQPTFVPQVTPVPVYIPVPENLLEVPPLTYPQDATFGQVEGVLYDGLQVCRGDLQAIKGITGTPPSSTKAPPSGL